MARSGTGAVRAKDALGRFGEDVAVRHLEDDGYVVLDRAGFEVP